MNSIRQLAAWTVLFAGFWSGTAAFADPVTGAVPPPAAAKTYDVKTLGAKGDGKTKDTAAIQRALDTCAADGGGTVIIPAGNFLIGSIKLGSKTTLKLDKGATLTGSPDVADYPPMKVRWEGEWRDGHSALICAQNVNDIAIIGAGAIQGPPPALSALRPPPGRGDMRGPSIFEPIEVKGLTLDGFTERYQGLWSIHMTYCENVHISNLTLRTTGSNGDGIDVDSTKRVLIEKCDIDTGDDAICLKSGRGMEAVRIARPTEDVEIRDCTLACSNFAGLGIGTEMSGGIRNIRVEHCIFARCKQNGIYIKSRTDRGGFIEDITFSDCEFKSDCATMVGVDLVTKGIAAAETVAGDDKWPRVKNIVFKNIKLDGVGGIVANCVVAPERPIDGFILSNVSGTARAGITLTNVINAKLENIQATVSQGALLRLTNVKGDNLDETKARAKPAP